MSLSKLKAQFQGNSLKAILLRGGLGSIALKVLSTLLSLLMAVVLVRSLEADGYGVYVLVLALVSVLAIPVQVGLPTIVVRETARAQVNHHWGLMRGLWRWSTCVVVGLTLSLLTISLLVAWILNERLTPIYLSTFYMGLLLVPLVALGNLRGAALRGLSLVLQGQLPESVIRPGLLVFFVVSANWFFGQKMTAASAMGLHVVASAFAFLIGAWLLWQARPVPILQKPKPEYNSKSWLKATLPLAIVSGINLFNTQADILMLGWFKSPVEVGVYRVAALSVTLIAFGLQASNSVIAPYISRFYMQGDFRRLQYLVTLSARVTVLVSLPIFLAFLLVGDKLLAIMFGAEFAEGYIVLVILACGNLINVGMGSSGILLNMSGFEQETAKGVAIAAATNLSLGLVLIPLFGMEGAAWGTALSLAIWNILLWRSARDNLNITCGIFAKL